MGRIGEYFRTTNHPTMVIESFDGRNGGFWGTGEIVVAALMGERDALRSGVGLWGFWLLHSYLIWDGR